MNQSEFIELVNSIVEVRLKNMNLQSGHWNLGKVDTIISRYALNAFVNGSSVSISIPCNPNIIFTPDDEIWIHYVNGDSRNKFVTSKRATGTESYDDGTGLGDMLKSVYDTTNNGKVDHAELADTVITNANLTGDVTGTGNSTAISPNVIVNSDINTAAGIDASKMADGSVSNAEYQYLGNVTSDIQTQLNAKQLSSEKGNANGYASLDSGAKIPISQLPDSIVGQVEYQGTWNATTNIPALATASGVKGYYYVVATAGTYLTIAYDIGDWVISNGVAWQKVDNTDAVSTVFGRSGNVVATTNDYTWAQINKSTSSIADILTKNASDLTTDSTHRFTSDADITKLSGVSTQANKTTVASVGSGSIEIDGISKNVYMHPSGDGNHHVPATSTTNNLKVLKSGSTAGSEAWGSVAFSELIGVPTTRVGYGITDAQGLDSTLTSLAAYNTNGILTQTALDTFVGRTIVGTTNKVVVTNGDGVSGNPTLTIGSDVVTLTDTQTLTNKSISGGQITSTVANATLASTVTTNANLTGDITSVGNTTTLSVTGVGAGTYKSVTVDTKGRVTAGTNPTTVAGYGITDALTSIPTASASVLGGIKVGANLTITSGVLSAYYTAIDTNYVIKKETFTATAGQTVFTLTTGTYVINSNMIDVRVNGYWQQSDAYVETSATVVTMNVGLVAGEIVTLKYIQAFSGTPYPVHGSTHVTGGVDVIPDAVAAGNSGLLSGTDKNKLDGIAVVGTTSITTLGNITTGTWTGTAIAVANGGTGATTTAGAKTNLSFMTRYATSIGNASSTSFVVTHSLGTKDVTILIYDNSTFEQVIADVVMSTTTTITVSFAVAPTLNQYRVVVMG